MVIELIGIPGSGKTTFVNNILTENNHYINPLELELYSDSRIKQNINKIRIIITLACIDPTIIFKLIKLFNKIKFKSIKCKLKMFLYLFSIIGVYEQYKKNKPNYTLIFDEGISQVIWGILYNSSNSEKQVYELYDSLKSYIADEIWYIQTPKEVVKERLLNRTKPGGAELQKDIRHSDNMLEISVDLLEEILNVIKIKNYSQIKNIKNN